MSFLDNTEITAEELAYKGLESLPSKYQKSVGFFAWDFFVAIGQVLFTFWDKIIYICKCLTDFKNMDYDDLVNFVYQTRGIVAKTATASTGYVTVEMDRETDIAIGSSFSTAEGIQFETLEEKEKVSGTVDILVECRTKGVKGNVLKDTITIIPTTLQHVTSVTNKEPFTNGYDAETKDELLERYYDDIRNSITSGNIYHYKKWAKEVTGVTDVKVKPLWNGDNTVKVVVLGKNLNDLDALAQKVQDYIDPKGENNETWGCGCGQAPIGAYCTVAPATKKTIPLSVDVILKKGYSQEEATASIINKVNGYFQSIAFESTTVSYTQVSAAILKAEGVIDHSNLLIDNDDKNIELIDSDLITEIAALTKEEEKLELNFKWEG